MSFTLFGSSTVTRTSAVYSLRFRADSLIEECAITSVGRVTVWTMVLASVLHRL